MADDLFSSARTVLRWANEGIDDLDVLSSSFFGDSYKPDLFIELDEAAGRQIHGYTLPRETPDNINRLAYHVIGDLRNSLDQAVHAASLRLKTTKPKKTNFPSADDCNGVRRRLETNPQCAGIPVELYPAILSLHPYWRSEAEPEGDSVLRTLFDIANPNKHRVFLGAAVDWHGINIRSVTGGATVDVRPLGEHKVQLYTVTPPGAAHQVDLDVQFHLVFGPEESGRIIGMPVAKALREISTRVGNAICALDGESEKLAAQAA